MQSMHTELLWLMSSQSVACLSLAGEKSSAGPGSVLLDGSRMPSLDSVSGSASVHASLGAMSVNRLLKDEGSLRLNIGSIQRKNTKNVTRRNREPKDKI